MKIVFKGTLLKLTRDSFKGSDGNLVDYKRASVLTENGDFIQVVVQNDAVYEEYKDVISEQGNIIFELTGYNGKPRERFVGIE